MSPKREGDARAGVNWCERVEHAHREREVVNVRRRRTPRRKPERRMLRSSESCPDATMTTAVICCFVIMQLLFRLLLARTCGGNKRPGSSFPASRVSLPLAVVIMYYIRLLSCWLSGFRARLGRDGPLYDSTRTRVVFIFERKQRER